MNRLVEVPFTQIMRAYIEQAETPTGILGAIAGPKLGLAMNAMHRHPEYPWSAETLAQESGMSRTAFSRHFHQLAGHPPYTT